MTLKHPHEKEVFARGRHYELQGNLAPGTVITTGASASEAIPIAGLLRCRVRIELTSGDGSLSGTFVRPGTDRTFDITALHTTGNPSNVAVAAPDTEYMLEIDDLYGEAYLLVKYTDTSGGSVIKRVSVSAL